MTIQERLVELAGKLPNDLAGQVVNFAEFLMAKAARKQDDGVIATLDAVHVDEPDA